MFLRRFLFSIILLFPFFAQAQALDPNQIVQWKFSVQPKGEHAYVVVAEATITKPFHIFHTDAGGDGTLINTELTLDNVQEEGEWTSQPKPTVKQFDVIEGDVFWHEGKVAFSKLVEVEEGATSITGEVYFQVCDDEKCLAPTAKKFEIKLK